MPDWSLLATKSRVLSAYDYRALDLSGVVPPFAPDEEALERALLNLRKRHAVPAEADTVEGDDFVTLRCASENRRFQKDSIVVRVGRGLFSRELEAGLLGLHKGGERQLTADGAPVTVRILEIRRLLLPPLTDENAALWNIDGAKTVEALKAALLARQREEFIRDTAEGMTGEVLTLINERSSFSLDESDLAREMADAHVMLRDMLRSSGVDPDTATEAELREETGMSLEEHTAFLEGIYRDSFCSFLLARELVRPEEVDASDEAYEAALRELSEQTGKSAAEAQEVLTPAKFLRQRVSDAYFERVETRIKQYLNGKE